MAESLDGDALLNGAIDGGDWVTAALLVIAHPRSATLPESVIAPLWAVAMGGEPTDVSKAQVRAVASFVQQGSDHVGPAAD